MFVNEIMNNWAGQPSNYIRPIASLSNSGFEAWTFKSPNSVGVAIPLIYNDHICESFASVELFDTDIPLPDGQRRCLLLKADGDQEKKSFATLCSEFVAPGHNGENRLEVSTNPIAWWAEWKELLGNKSVDQRVYDVIGELSVLEYLAKQGKRAAWNGPTSSTYDIDCDDRFIEVKSSTMRSKKEITLSNQFQLVPPDGRDLTLILCQLESSSSGRSINNLVSQLVAYGYSKTDLNTKLKKLGLGEGKSARNRCYVMHAMTEYVVDEKFPAIRNESFVGGKLPSCIQGITYTVSLDGVDGTTLLYGGGGNN